MKMTVARPVRRLASTLLAGVALILAVFGCSPAAAQMAYKNPKLPVENRVDDLLSRMTLDEKVGQMTQLARDRLSPSTVKSLGLGSVLSGGGSSPYDNSPKGWRAMVDSFQRAALGTRLGIPILYGVDSVHGNNNLKNATVFPHNIGLGAANDSSLTERIGAAVARETAACGVTWTFAPCLAVVRDPRWGRTYESFGQDSALVTPLGAAFTRGYVGALVGKSALPITCAKHFLGDGNTAFGSSTTGNYLLDQGNTVADENFLRTVLVPPYRAALDAGARTVMVSFSSWNGEKMHGRADLITGLLKGDLGFTGFVVSDWAGIDQVDPDYDAAVVTAINAGVDMAMVPYEGDRFIQSVKRGVASGAIPQTRVDDAVRRILRVKFETGLFDRPMSDPALAPSVRSAEHLALARDAVAKSLVVLKNNNALPLAASLPRLYVCGSVADDIGLQCGGWTMTWQGAAGEITAGTTILGGIREKLPGDRVVYAADGDFAAAGASAIDRTSPCLLVVGEAPYAEGVGDSDALGLLPQDEAAYRRARAAFDTVIVTVVSGRPLILDAIAGGADAIVAVWLPGSEGSGVADVLFGDVKPTGKLPVDWPARVDQLPSGNFIAAREKSAASGKAIPRAQTPQWPVGFGLTY